MFKILLAPDSGAAGGAGGAGGTGGEGSQGGNTGPQGGGEGLKPEELKAQLKAKEEELVKLKAQEKLLNAPKPDEPRCWQGRRNHAHKSLQFTCYLSQG